MAFYRQSAACPKLGATHGSSSGANYGRNTYPASAAIYAPAKIPPSMENPTRWTPYGTFVSHPYFGGWDGLGGRLMHVSQADMYDTHTNPFPANSVDDQPNAQFNLLRLEPTTSAHPGLSLSSGPGPAMLFHAPPVFGLQTIPVVAVGI